MARSNNVKDQLYKGGGGNNTNGLLSKITTIGGYILLILLLAIGVMAVKKGVIPLVSMYRQANKLVSESTKDTFRAEQTSIVYDADGNMIKKLKGEKDVYYLNYKKIPDAAKLAIISIEDKNFTTHKGLDLQGIARAVLTLVVTRSKGMGGSTITMQLARNIFLNFEKTYSRKITEIFISAELERKYTKEELLEFYLNNVNFANGYYGIEAAAQGYFNKSATELTISQIVTLCAIPNSPTRFDPYENLEGTLKRRDRILLNMYEDGYLSEDQYHASLEEEIVVKPKRSTSTNDYAQTYIIKCATESLMRLQGFPFQYQFSSDAEEAEYNEAYNELYSTCKQTLSTAGYRIYTSINTEMQTALQTSVSNELSMFMDKTDGGVYEVQGAAVCIDNSTGRVVAIVGGREEDQEGYGLNRAFQSFRQPGSSIKPVLVYGPALDMGYTPDSDVDDSRMSGPDSVSNADFRYQGEISMRKAVQKSSNVATLRLYQDLGTAKCLRYLEKMNFNGLKPADYEYDTTCIGGFTYGATAVEMAASYATLANDGVYRTPTCIIKITDADGNVIMENDQDKKEIYSTEAACMMTDILETTVTSSSATAHNCELEQDMPAACKTGTTSSNCDGWLCGYTPYYTTAVWVGKDIYESVDNLKGNTYPAYIWKNFMDKATAYSDRDTISEEQFGEYYN